MRLSLARAGASPGAPTDAPRRQPACAKIHSMRWGTCVGVVAAACVAADAALGAAAAPCPPRSGEPQALARAVAAHVASRYFVSEYGGRFVTVAPGKLELTQANRPVPVKVVAVRRGKGAKAPVVAHGTGHTIVYSMCGSAAGCSIPGAATL